MTSDRRAQRWQIILPLVVPLLIVLGTAAWWHLHGADKSPAAEPEMNEQSAPMPKVPRPKLALPPPSAGPEPAAPTDAQSREPAHPHPITPEHERIFRENALIGELNGAMDVKDGPGLRKLLNQYRDEYPDDPNQLQTGYGIIADCLEHPGTASTSAGQRYYDRERGSILRRFVGRHCLGNGD